MFIDEGGADDQQASDAMIEMKAYNKQKCIDSEKDPLEYWKVCFWIENVFISICD